MLFQFSFQQIIVWGAKRLKDVMATRAIHLHKLITFKRDGYIPTNVTSLREFL